MIFLPTASDPCISTIHQHCMGLRWSTVNFRGWPWEKIPPCNIKMSIPEKLCFICILILWMYIFSPGTPQCCLLRNCRKLHRDPLGENVWIQLCITFVSISYKTWCLCVAPLHLIQHVTMTQLNWSKTATLLEHSNFSNRRRFLTCLLMRIHVRPFLSRVIVYPFQGQITSVPRMLKQLNDNGIFEKKNENK